MTNASIRGPVDEELRQRFTALRGVKNFLSFDGNWIASQIRENQRLRTLVPRVYGLGDLTEILDERVYEQASAILSWFGDDLERFVITDAHRRSIAALHDKRFVFLLGDPGSGKSTIAAALALAAADEWKSRVIKIQNAEDFKNHWNPKESNQFFWIDDAFGQTQYERDQTLQWNCNSNFLQTALKREARMIFTSRTYIYKAAVRNLKDSLLPLLRDSQVVIEVEKLTKQEKEQMLYNHLRLGNQPSSFRRKIKPFLPDFAAHQNFLPETARRIGNSIFTKKIGANRESVLHFVAEPEEYMIDVIKGLSDAEQAALGLAFIGGGKVNAPLDLKEDEIRSLRLMNSDVGEVRKSIHHLEGSLMVKEIENGEYIYRFKHPTIRDAFGGVIGDDPNLMDIYLCGARAEALIHEVTCGDVELEGVRLIVPESRFAQLLGRLTELMNDKNKEKHLISFLASRCSSEFLIYFNQQYPDFIENIEPTNFPRSYLVYSDEVTLLTLFYKYGILTEAHRKRFVESASRAARSSMEWRFMALEDVRALFRYREIHSLRASIKPHLTSKLLQNHTEYLTDEWKKEMDEDPESYFRFWKMELGAFSREFRKNRKIFARFSNARKNIDKVISSLQTDWEKNKDALQTTEASNQEANIARSIFDDVDA